MAESYKPSIRAIERLLGSAQFKTIRRSLKLVLFINKKYVGDNASEAISKLVNSSNYGIIYYSYAIDKSETFAKLLNCPELKQYNRYTKDVIMHPNCANVWEWVATLAIKSILHTKVYYRDSSRIKWIFLIAHSTKTLMSKAVKLKWPNLMQDILINQENWLQERRLFCNERCQEDCQLRRFGWHNFLHNCKFLDWTPEPNVNGYPMKFLSSIEANEEYQLSPLINAVINYNAMSLDDVQTTINNINVDLYPLLIIKIRVYGILVVEMTPEIYEMCMTRGETDDDLVVTYHMDYEHIFPIVQNDWNSENRQCKYSVYFGRTFQDGPRIEHFKKNTYHKSSAGRQLRRNTVAFLILNQEYDDPVEGYKAESCYIETFKIRENFLYPIRGDPPLLNLNSSNQGLLGLTELEITRLSEFIRDMHPIVTFNENESNHPPHVSQALINGYLFPGSLIEYDPELLKDLQETEM